MAVLLPRFQVKITHPATDEVRYVQAISRITVSLSSDKPCDSAEVHVPVSKKVDISILRPDPRDSEKRKPQIEISFGYEGERAELTKVFTGVVDWVSPDLPLVIKAEDAFSAAKHSHIKETFCKGGEKRYYSEIAKDIMDQAGLKLYVPPQVDPGPGKMQLSAEFPKQTVAQAMAKLSEETQWVHFCIPGENTIYFGPDWPYLLEYLPMSKTGGSSKIELYRIGSGRERSNYDAGSQFSPSWGNIISAGSLKYRIKKPYKKVTCNLVDREQRNTSVSGEAEEEGETEGQEYSFTEHYSFDAGKSEAENEAKRRAEEKLAGLNAAQYEGSFTTFGNSQLKHSDCIRIESAEHPTRTEGDKGYYDAKSVTFDYSPSGGFRMTVEVRKPPEGLL